MIDPRPWDDLAAMAVFRGIDPWDRMEAAAIRGVAVTHVGLFADWRAARGATVADWVVHAGAGRGEAPFAVVCIANTGQAGVAQAAMLACEHRRFRRELVALARLVRVGLPNFCGRLGIRRVEARAWRAHPTASRFLTAAGFRPECDMPGFGAAGFDVFRQFAWVAPACVPHKED